MVNYWLFIGPALSGKSTLVAQMESDFLVLDFDGRWKDQEVADRSHLIANDNPMKIINRMEELRPGLQKKVKTVVIDSGTALLDYETSLDRLREVRANDAFKRKADLMRSIAGSILRWEGASAAWIFHIDHGMLNGKAVTRQTIPNTELERLKKYLHAVFEVFVDNGRRGVKVVWSRFWDGAAVGHVIWDTNMWKGVPKMLSDFTRNFRGTEGYNGRAYSPDWLLEFLASKGKKFGSVEEMTKALKVTQYPTWWDRNSWGELIKRAGV